GTVIVWYYPASGDKRRGNGNGGVILMMFEPVIKGGDVQVMQPTVVFFRHSALLPGVEMVLPFTTRIPCRHISPQVRCID
ncbi:hypothetical protein CQJ39_21725, partial [Yersinia pestis]